MAKIVSSKFQNGKNQRIFAFRAIVITQCERTITPIHTCFNKVSSSSETGAIITLSELHFLTSLPPATSLQFIEFIDSNTESDSGRNVSVIVSIAFIPVKQITWLAAEGSNNRLTTWFCLPARRIFIQFSRVNLFIVKFYKMYLVSGSCTKLGFGILVIARTSLSRPYLQAMLSGALQGTTS